MACIKNILGFCPTDFSWGQGYFRSAIGAQCKARGCKTVSAVCQRKPPSTATRTYLQQISCHIGLCKCQRRASCAYLDNSCFHSSSSHYSGMGTTSSQTSSFPCAEANCLTRNLALPEEQDWVPSEYCKKHCARTGQKTVVIQHTYNL